MVVIYDSRVVPDFKIGFGMTRGYNHNNRAFMRLTRCLVVTVGAHAQQAMSSHPSTGCYVDNSSLQYAVKLVTGKDQN